MFYFHLHGNYGYLFLKLPGEKEWTDLCIEYVQDVRSEIESSQAKRIPVKDLPAGITESFVFQQIVDSILEVWELTSPASEPARNPALLP